MALGRDDILAVEDTATKLIDIPAWSNDDIPAQVYIRSVSSRERDDLEQVARGKNKNLDNFRARCAALFLSDEHGKPLFGTSDIPLLGKKCAAALDVVMIQGLKFNEMDEEATDRAEKN